MSHAIIKKVETIAFRENVTKVEVVGKFDLWGEAEYQIEGASIWDCWFRVELESCLVKAVITRVEETNSIVINLEEHIKSPQQSILLVTAYRRV